MGRKLPHLFREPSNRSIKISIEETIEEFTNAIKWLKSINADPHNTRISHYKNHLEKFNIAYKNNSLDKFYQKQSIGEHVLLLSEIEEILGVYRFLSTSSSKEFLKKVKQTLKGGLIPADEKTASSSNRPRNILFELYLASICTSAGFSVSLNDNADITINFENREIFIECKRPQFDHKVNSSIKSAVSQLKSRYNSSSNPDSARGVIAISTSKIITKGNKFRTISSEEVLTFESYNFFMEFISSHKKKWNAKAESKTLAVILFLNLPTFLREKGTIFINQGIGACPIEKLKKEDFSLAERFFKKLESSTIK